MHYLLPLAFTAATAAFTYDELWNLQNSLWENFLYPQNLQQINATDTSVFTEDVQGRVDITRTFDGRELNTEYNFGLFTDPDHVSLVGVPINYTITQFAALENITSASTLFTFNATSFNNTLLPITIDTWILFTPEGKISQYDSTFRWFGWLVQTLLETAGPTLFNTTDAATTKSKLAALLADTICQTHEDYCLGPNKQYDSKPECVDFLTKEIRFGEAHELGMNTLLCREVHEHMVQYRPAQHCPHIGPSGGSYCVDDRGYGDVVTERYFREGFIPFGGGVSQG
ncbi:hypothetical protein BJY04DRAFT_147447 [Aspergillus karnatakaensis]|uniref:uncharacterized protein n=1 Tax=Aspergillus karnatakaensis TaxID=1810916 RepID=UPI003CCD5F18